MIYSTKRSESPSENRCYFLKIVFFSIEFLTKKLCVRISIKYRLIVRLFIQPNFMKMSLKFPGMLLPYKIYIIKNA